MHIPSSLASGVQGFQRAEQQINNNASNIARLSTSDTAASSSDSALEANEPIELGAELVDMKLAEHQAQASANVLKTADEVIGTLIDTTS